MKIRATASLFIGHLFVVFLCALSTLAIAQVDPYRIHINEKPVVNWGSECEQRGGKTECKRGTPGPVVWTMEWDYVDSLQSQCGSTLINPSPFGNGDIHTGCSTPEEAAASAISKMLAFTVNGKPAFCSGAYRGLEETGWGAGQRNIVDNWFTFSWPFELPLGQYTTEPGGAIVDATVPDPIDGCAKPSPVVTGLIVGWARNIRCDKGFVPESGAMYCVKPPVDCCIRFGNPIDVGTSAKVQRESDISIAGATEFVFERHYNSRLSVPTSESMPASSPADRAKILGPAWRHNYQRQIVLEETNTTPVVRVVGASGNYVTFQKNGGSWIPYAHHLETLVETRSGATISGWDFTTADDTVEKYDTSGRLLSITKRNGLRQIAVYTDGSATGANGAVAVDAAAVLPAGLLLRVSDDFGRDLTFHYFANSYLAGVVGPDSTGVAFAYDGTGRLSSATYADGKSRRYIYSTADSPSTLPFSEALLTGIVDENNVRAATYSYDSLGRAVSTEGAGGVNKFTISYPWANSISGSQADVLITSPLAGVFTSRIIQANGIYRGGQERQPCTSAECASLGFVFSSVQYDSRGNVSFRSDLNGNTSIYSYEPIRNLETSRTEAANSTNPRVTTTTWHPTFLLPATITEPTSAGNRLTTFTYDALGNLIAKAVTVAGVTRTSSWTFDSYGRILTAIDPLGRTITNTYYANSSDMGNKRGMLNTVTNAAGHLITINDYNAYGQPLSISDPNGLVTTIAYDPRNRVISRSIGGETTTYVYDGVGQLAKITLPDSSYLQYTYDDARRLVEIKDGLNNRVIYTLDNMGNRIKEDYADPSNVLARTRSREFDVLSRLRKDIGGATPTTQVTQYAYDPQGNQTSTTDPLGRTTIQNFDAFDRLIEVIDPFNGIDASTKFEYDIQGNLAKVTDPKGLNTVYTYNGFNELVTQVSPDTGTTSFSYDAAGNMLTKTDARNVSATYTYDALNRISTIGYPAIGADTAQTVTYVYDNCANGKGRLCSVTDQTGATTWSYNLQGRVTGRSQSTQSLTQSIGYGYNGNGQLSNMTLPSGKVVTYTYLNNRVIGMTYDGQQVLKNAEYEPFGPIGEWTWGNDSASAPNKHTRYFDLDGRIGKIEADAAQDPSLIIYDAASRITALQKMTGISVDAAKSSSYGYDALDHLTTVTPNTANANPTRAYTYDGAGNRLTETVASSTTNYGYGTSSHRLNSLSGAIAKSYSYDSNGNRTTDGTSTWSYGGNNRPFSIALSGTTVLIGINALGQRVTKTVNGTVTRFMYDEGGRLIGEYDGAGNAKQETLWFNDMPVAVIK